MTLDSSAAAGLTAILPAGHAVTDGDTLTVEEARDLVILQNGLAPLQPLGVSATSYVVTQFGAVTAQAVFSDVISGAPALIIDESQAQTLAEAWMVFDDFNIDVPVPIGAGKFVPKGFTAMNCMQSDLFIEWHTQLLSRTFAADAMATNQPRGLA